MAMSQPLSGRVAIVTGATRGIGRAVTLHLSSLGASVAIGFTSSSAEAKGLAVDINNSANSIRAVPIRADVSDPSAVRSLFDLTEEAFHAPPHIVVHAAGIKDPAYQHIASAPIAVFDSIISVNVRGAFLVLQQAVNRVVKGGGGRIIMFSTSQVGINNPGSGAYAASKAAVESMVRTVAKELKGTKITANCVAPGPVETELFFAGKTDEDVKRIGDMNPMGRIGVTEDIAPVVGLLCSDSGEWINGQVIRVNGGSV